MTKNSHFAEIWGWFLSCPRGRILQVSRRHHTQTRRTVHRFVLVFGPHMSTPDTKVPLEGREEVRTPCWSLGPICVDFGELRI